MGNTQHKELNVPIFYFMPISFDIFILTQKCLFTKGIFSCYFKKKVYNINLLGEINMLKEQIRDLNIKKILCKKSSAIIYLLSDGRVFKRFLFEEVDRYSDKGISLENKILEGERLKEHKEFYGPLSAVYRKSTFVGYTMDFNKGKNMIKYFDSLKYKYSQSNLKFCASRYKKLESVVKKAIH